MAKTALVTGGSKRIGAAICKDLASHGFDLAIHYASSAAEAEALADKLAESGIKTTSIKADLACVDETRALFEQAEAALGPIDLLINNASVFKNDSAYDFDPDLMALHHAVHVQAPAILSSAMANQSELSAGLIVNLIDERVWRLNPNFFTYTLSKTAMWTATQTMAQAFAPKVRVNGIGPGPTLPNERQSQADFDRQVAAVPMGRGPDLADFGRTIRYLYETPSVTGQMIALDGGQHLAWETPDVAGIVE